MYFPGEGEEQKLAMDCVRITLGVYVMGKFTVTFGKAEILNNNPAVEFWSSLVHFTDHLK
jgi:hypothetical protein